MHVQIDRVLEQVMHARAAGHAQHRVLYNPTPEVDSLVEEIIALPIDTAVRRRLLDFVRQVAHLNHAEAEHERAAAGTLDELLTIGRRAVTTAPRGTTMSVKTIAGLLRPALRTGGDPADIIVRGLLTRVPRSTLLGKGMRGELGKQPHATLTLLVERIETGA